MGHYGRDLDTKTFIVHQNATTATATAAAAATTTTTTTTSELEDTKPANIIAQEEHAQNVIQLNQTLQVGF